MYNKRLKKKNRQKYFDFKAGLISESSKHYLVHVIFEISTRMFIAFFGLFTQYISGNSFYLSVGSHHVQFESSTTLKVIVILPVR